MVTWTIDQSGYSRERTITQNASSSPEIARCLKRYAIEHSYKHLTPTGACRVRARISYKDPKSHKTNRGSLYEMRRPTQKSAVP